LLQGLKGAENGMESILKWIAIMLLIRKSKRKTVTNIYFFGEGLNVFLSLSFASSESYSFSVHPS